MKKKAIKIAASTAVAASAFVAAAPAQQADAATNATTLATNAQNAGTVLKWAISYEGSADFTTRPYNEFNAAKKAVAAAEAAAAKLGTNEKLSLQAKLVDAKIQIVRATAYIDAITSSEKIKALTSDLNAAIATGDLGKVETAYHAASFEYKKQAKLLDRVYGQSTRDGIRNAVKPAMEAALDSVKYDVTVKMHLDKASALIKEGKLELAAAELAKADYNLTLKDAKFTFKTQLQKSYDDVAVSLPLQAVSAVGDGKNTVTVKFSKAYTLDKTLTTLEAGQFKINGLTVQSAKLSEDKKSVILTTSTQAANTEYTVTWQGKSVSFKTAAVADTSGIAVNQTDVAYLETTDSRTYTAKLTNADGTPYVGGVTISLSTNAANITTVNGNLNSQSTWTGVTDSNGNLVFTVAVPANSASITDVEAIIKKTDSTETSKKTAKTHFFKLADVSKNYELAVKKFHIAADNDYVYADGLKFKWDANDQFFIRGQQVTQASFETALSKGDTLTVDYKTKAENTSTWNITVDVTEAEEVEFTNPVDSPVTFDGYNYDLSGTAQANHTVKVYRGTTLMGTTTANASGNWTLRAVNLTQDVTNTFTAYQYAPGKDGVNGVGSENPTTPARAVINEGAFASESINVVDNGDNGLSRFDVLDFTFKNSSYDHKFNDSVKEGTITVTDGQSRTAKLTVKKVGNKQLEVTNVTDATRGFNFNSSTISVVSATGVVNQDQLAYNVSESKGKVFNFGVIASPEVKGLVSNVSTDANAFSFGGNTYFLDGKSVLTNKDNTPLLYGTDIVDSTGGNQLVDGDQVVVSVVNGVTTIKRTATKAELDAATALTAATTKVTALETAAAKDLTVLTNLEAAEAAYTAANTAVNALSNSTDRTALQTKVTTANQKVTTARTVYNAKVANADIATAKGLISNTVLKADELNLINVLKAETGMPAGIALAVKTEVSGNDGAKIATDGTVTQGSTQQVISVVITIAKTNGTTEEKTITVTVPAAAPVAPVTP